MTPPGRHSVLNHNNYPQLLGMINPWTGKEAPGILLYHGNPVRGAWGETFFGPNTQMWDWQGNRIDPDRFITEQFRIVTLAGATPPAMVARNSTTRLMADIGYKDSSTIVWTSNNPNIATVNADGVVTARAMAGNVIITARDTVSGFTHTIQLRVA